MDMDKRTGRSAQAEADGTSMTRREALRKARKRKDEQARWLIFLIFIVIYCGILGVLAYLFLRYTDRSLVRYEASQSVYAMDSFFEEYEKQLNNGKIPDCVDLTAYADVYCPIDYVEKTFLAETEGKQLHYEKDPSSYDTENPVYLILADDELVSKVTFEGYDGEVILGILTVLSWRVSNVETYYTNPEGSVTEDAVTDTYERETTDYTFTVPQGYTVYVNSMALGESELTDEVVEMKEFTYAKEYVNLSGMQVYRLRDIGCPIRVRITDFDGNVVDYVQDGTDYTAGYTYGAEMPEDLMQYCLQAAESWQLMMTRDMSFEGVAPYLIAGSYYYDMGYRFATGGDITFVSPHTLNDPAISGVSVTDYVKYADNCFSCRIQFQVNMHLTVTGQDAVNAMDSKFLFVYYDDSDDGVDNPHWAIADMTSDVTADETANAGDSNL